MTLRVRQWVIGDKLLRRFEGVGVPLRCFWLVGTGIKQSGAVREATDPAVNVHLASI